MLINVKSNIYFFHFSFSGSKTSSGSGARDLSFREADVFMLCYKISDPATLFSALNFWCPEVRAVSPDAPIILVGCQSDLRGDRDVISGLAKSGRAPVSSDQALSFSRQISAVIYAFSNFGIRGCGTCFNGKNCAKIQNVPLQSSLHPLSRGFIEEAEIFRISRRFSWTKWGARNWCATHHGAFRTFLGALSIFGRKKTLKFRSAPCNAPYRSSHAQFKQLVPVCKLELGKISSSKQHFDPIIYELFMRFRCQQNSEIAA